MPVLATQLLTAGSNSSSNSYVTASVSIVGGTVALLAIGMDNGGTAAPTISSVTGAGLTWTQIATLTDSGGTRRISLYRAFADSSTSGAITINLGATLGTGGIQWSITQMDNVDTGGANGANAIVQSATNTQNNVQSHTVTLSAFTDVANATYGAIFQNAAFAITPGSGFAELGEVTNTSTIESEFRSDNDTSVDWSWTNNAVVEGIAVELKFLQRVSKDDNAYFM